MADEVTIRTISSFSKQRTKSVILYVFLLTNCKTTLYPTIINIELLNSTPLFSLLTLDLNSEHTLMNKKVQSHLWPACLSTNLATPYWPMELSGTTTPLVVTDREGGHMGATEGKTI